MVAPYRVPMFENLAARDCITELRILTCVDRELDREWQVPTGSGYAVKKLWGLTKDFKKSDGAHRILHLKFGIFWELLRHRPERLIIGDASWTSYLAAITCISFRIPYVVWNEITTSSKVRKGVLSKLRLLIYRYSDSCIASCQMARDFLLDHGCSDKKIVIANNCVDNQDFLSVKRKFEPHRQSIRDALQIPDNALALIFVGQLIPRKRVEETLDACAVVNSRREVHLLIVGSGPLEHYLKAKAKRLGYNWVHFLGFADRERLAQLYVASDAAVLLSDDEPWGMVINEAMLFGKPFLASKDVAAAVELIDSGAGLIKNEGATFPEAMEDFISSIERQNFSASTPPSAADMANGFIKAIYRQDPD